MWCPGDETIPQQFIDVLVDEEEEADELVDGIVEAEDMDLDIATMPVYLVGPDGDEMEELGVGDVRPAEASLTDSDDEEWKQAHQVIEDAISPLSSPTRRTPASPPVDAAPVATTLVPPPPRFRIQIQEPVAARRGRASQRGRGRGSRRVRGGGRIGVPERRWMRGDLMEELYVDDSDLPLHIQQQIRTHLAARNRTRRDVNVDLNEDEQNEDQNEDDLIGLNEPFIWKSMYEWRGERCQFQPETIGPTSRITKPYEAMHAIWTDGIMDHIVMETNRYARSVLAEQRARFMRDWYETNLHEMWTLFAFWIMLGIIRMPSIKSCFTRMPLLKTDVFRFLFSECRYWNLNAAFHLVEGSDDSNPLHAMGPIIDHLNSKFQDLYRLDREICIDESLTLWKGPVAFKQYIKTKSARFGIKTYELCESATGYLWSFFVYVGRTTGAGNLPTSMATVLKLIRPVLNLGHTLFMDNWFNSPTLARWLKRRNTDCVGTLRPTRKEVPEAIKRVPLREGQFIARASDDVMVVALQDRKRVTCVSTYHDVSQVQVAAKPGRPAQHKLRVVHDYNKGMGGVDLMDSMLEAYLIERKQCIKWNKKLFKRLFNISIQNARVIVEKSTGSKIDSLAFRLALVQDIIQHHHPHVPRKPSPAQQRISMLPLNRLTDRHFIRRILVTEEMHAAVRDRTNLGRRHCVWCRIHYGRPKRKTCYECPECEVPLCLDTCFKEFHTLQS